MIVVFVLLLCLLECRRQKGRENKRIKKRELRLLASPLTLTLTLKMKRDKGNHGKEEKHRPHTNKSKKQHKKKGEKPHVRKEQSDSGTESDPDLKTKRSTDKNRRYLADKDGNKLCYNCKSPNHLEAMCIKPKRNDKCSGSKRKHDKRKKHEACLNTTHSRKGSSKSDDESDYTHSSDAISERSSRESDDESSDEGYWDLTYFAQEVSDSDIDEEESEESEDDAPPPPKKIVVKKKSKPAPETENEGSSVPTPMDTTTITTTTTTGDDDDPFETNVVKTPVDNVPNYAPPNVNTPRTLFVPPQTYRLSGTQWLCSTAVACDPLLGKWKEMKVYCGDPQPYMSDPGMINFDKLPLEIANLLLNMTHGTITYIDLGMNKYGDHVRVPVRSDALDKSPLELFYGAVYTLPMLALMMMKYVDGKIAREQLAIVEAMPTLLLDSDDAHLAYICWRECVMYRVMIRIKFNIITLRPGTLSLESSARWVEAAGFNMFGEPLARPLLLQNLLFDIRSDPIAVYNWMLYSPAVVEYQTRILHRNLKSVVWAANKELEVLLGEGQSGDRLVFAGKDRTDLLEITASIVRKVHHMAAENVSLLRAYQILKKLTITVTTSSMCMYDVYETNTTNLCVQEHSTQIVNKCAELAPSFNHTIYVSENLENPVTNCNKQVVTKPTVYANIENDIDAPPDLLDTDSEREIDCEYISENTPDNSEPNCSNVDSDGDDDLSPDLLSNESSGDEVTTHQQSDSESESEVNNQISDNEVDDIKKPKVEKYVYVAVDWFDKEILKHLTDKDWCSI